jgi:hypothetical protein
MARMAVVFPAPAGAIASCSRAPDVHICRTWEACPASSAVLFAISSRARSTADSSTADPSRRHAVMTRRRSASRIRYRSAPATV